MRQLLLVAAIAVFGCSNPVEIPRRDSGLDAAGSDAGSMPDGGMDAELPDSFVPPIDAGPPQLADGSSIYDELDGEAGMFLPELCPAASIVAEGCLGEVNEGAAGLCNQLDDDCDGHVDENCECNPGDVQACFRGPPGRRHVGACADGMQACMNDGEFGGAWGDCTGGIPPSIEVCDSLDNDCNGCTDEVAGCTPPGACPGPGDPRVPDGAPFVDYRLNGPDFYSGTARSWSWTVDGGPCDSILPRPTFTVENADSAVATLRPTLSGDYTVTMTVVTDSGATFTCRWIVHILGPGLRVEMCYREAETQDLDLFLAGPTRPLSWYVDTNDAFQPAPQVCGWHDCEATIRGTQVSGAPYPRANWGYADTDISHCAGGPHGPEWMVRGSCANPRLDVDNNLAEGTGVPENINADDPVEGDTFRIMVQNFTGTVAHPVVNIYCGGRRVATYGAPPDEVLDYAGTSGFSGIGAMWRVADIMTHVDAVSGETTCEVHSIRPPGTPHGWDVSYDDPRY